MALALLLSEPAKRGDVFYLNPFDVEVREALRGRKFPPTAEEILAMATSMHDDGLGTPVACRRVEQNKPQLVKGFTRCCAARMIREGFTGADGVQRHNPEFKLKACIVDCNDREALRSNIIENAIRNETSPIDDAHNHRRLREEFGHSDAEIAALYQYPNQNKVSRLKKLLAYSDEVQLLIHKGLLPVQAAIDLLDLPEDKRAEAIKVATNDKGVVNGADIASQVREHHLNDDNPLVVPPTAGGEQTGATPRTKGLKPRTIRELRKFYTEIIEEEGTDEAVVAFCKDMLAHVNGKKSNKQGKNAILRLLDATAAK